MFLKSYEISSSDLRSAITGGPGRTYSMRHLEIANNKTTPKFTAWGHKTIAILESIPLVGDLFALIERIISFYFRASSQTPKQNPLKQVQILPSKPSEQKSDSSQTSKQNPLNEKTQISAPRLIAEEVQEVVKHMEQTGTSVSITDNGTTVSSEISFDEFD